MPSIRPWMILLPESRSRRPRLPNPRLTRPGIPRTSSRSRPIALDTAVRMPFHAFVVVVLTVFHALRMVVLIGSIRVVTNVLMAFHTTAITVLMAFQTVLSVWRSSCTRRVKRVMTRGRVADLLQPLRKECLDGSPDRVGGFLDPVPGRRQERLNAVPVLDDDCGDDNDRRQYQSEGVCHHHKPQSGERGLGEVQGADERL